MVVRNRPERSERRFAIYDAISKAAKRDVTLIDVDEGLLFGGALERHRSS